MPAKSKKEEEEVYIEVWDIQKGEIKRAYFSCRFIFFIFINLTITYVASTILVVFLENAKKRNLSNWNHTIN